MSLTISQRILLGFGIVVAMTLGLGLYGVSKLGQVRDTTSEIADNDFTTLTLLGEIHNSQNQMRVLRERAFGQYLLHKARLTDREPILVQQEWHSAKQQTQRLLSELESTSAEYEKTGVAAQRRTQWGKIRENAAETRATLNETAQEMEAQFELLDRGDVKAVIARMETLERLRQSFTQNVKRGSRLVQEALEIGKAEAMESYEEALASTLIALVAVVFLGIVSSISIQRSISRPLLNFLQFTERVGQGDLTQQAMTSREDELGRLGQSLNQMMAGLKDMAQQTRAATENLNSASAEILASTQQQAASMTEQAAAVQQTTVTMEESRQSGREISERANKVATAAESTAVTSQSGLQAVQEVTRTMEGIREQAEEVAENIVALSEKTQAIGEIIGTVNDIAEQSHLLALNASIEAAAAGEQGRSFSVVAGEMKNLADQAKTATVQVRSILEAIQKGINRSVMLTEEAVKRTEAGGQQVEVTERTIQQMARSIQESIQAFQQIVAGTNQQQIGFEQVTQALQNIRQATEETTSGTRQLETAATNLNALGHQLRSVVQRYRV